jgi:hypothetical protein
LRYWDLRKLFGNFHSLKPYFMNKLDLQHRTRKSHVSVIKTCERFLKNAAGFETAKQLIRAAGSVGANYRAACRAKSRADFIYKMNVVLEEADEIFILAGGNQGRRIGSIVQFGESNKGR